MKMTMELHTEAKEGRSWTYEKGVVRQQLATVRIPVQLEGSGRDARLLSSHTF